MDEILEGLNPAQREAVINYRGPALIVAGAGSGKTRVLTCRIAYMLSQGVPPWKVLALTFTNKAAAEMRERIAAMVGPDKSRYIWMGTFHSIFLRILREEADKIGFDRNFSIYDTSDSKNLIKHIIKELNLSDETYKPGAILSRISLAKNNLITPQAYAASAELMSSDREHRVGRIQDVYAEYARRCRENGAMDFDDMLLYTNILLRDFPDVLARYQQRFDYLLVDEYQDTNYAQYVIIRRLAAGHENVAVVGDDAQSIYSFRGAKIENILRFRKDYPEAKTYKLERNYRSTKNIVDAANCVIWKNKGQIRKESFSEGPTGEPIHIRRAYTDQEEAAIVADEIRALARGAASHPAAAWSDIALLYRTNMQSRAMEEALRRRGVPYKIYSGTSFYQRKEVKDMLAYFRLVVNPRDNEAFTRIVNFPARGLGDVTLARLVAAAHEAGLSLMEAASTLPAETLGIKGAAAAKLHDFVEMINGFSLQRSEPGLYQLGLEVASRSGILTLYKVDRSPEAQSALDNIEELLNSMQLFSEQDLHEESYEPSTGELIIGAPIAPTLDEWLQNIALMTDQDNEGEEERNKVTLMTVHAAKGLEFRYVFIVGLEENLFPSMMSLAPEALEEERRLFYVALTRAKEAAILSFAQSRFKWGRTEMSNPSRFLREIDPKYIDADFDMAACFLGGAEVDDEEGGFVAGGARRSSNAGRPAPGSGKTAMGRDLGNKFRIEGNRIVPKNAVPFPQPARPTDRSPQPTKVRPGSYEIGMTVEHAKFGRGTITAIEQMAGDQKIVVDFEEWGPKTLLAKFAKLTII